MFITIVQPALAQEGSSNHSLILFCSLMFTIIKMMLYENYFIYIVTAVLYVSVKWNYLLCLTRV